MIIIIIIIIVTNVIVNFKTDEYMRKMFINSGTQATPKKKSEFSQQESNLSPSGY